MLAERQHLRQIFSECCSKCKCCRNNCIDAAGRNFEGDNVENQYMNKVVHCVLFNQSENYLTDLMFVRPSWQFEYGPYILTSRIQKNKGLS